jgi:hypothetical protein
MTEHHVTVSDWPPPPDLSAVIAEVDGRWIEVRRKTNLGRPSDAWEDDWEGYGYDPKPTRWFALPTETIRELHPPGCSATV